MTRDEVFKQLDPSFLPLVQKFLFLVDSEGIKISIISARRTIKEQDALYAQGRTVKGDIVTRAKGGQSPHNFNSAIDICPLDKNGKLQWTAPDSVWKRLGELGKEAGLVWGGDFKSIKDLPHFESPTWKTIQTAWKAGKINVA